MSQLKLRYSDFEDRINVDAFEEAIDWAPEHTHNDNDVGYCPFPENHAHGDTTGKFAIHREKRVYNCWACGGGSLLSLAMELKDLSMEEATKWLYEFTEKDVRSDREFADEFIDAFRDVEKRVETLPYFNQRVLDRHDDPLPKEWLESRGIDRDVALRFNLRYNERMFRGVPRSPKFADHDDYEGPAILFPHTYKDRLVGWQCRWLDEERPEWVPKYTMTSDFPKENTLYGWDDLYYASSGEMVFVVESVPSVLFLASQGFEAVATFGSSVNDAQMRLLRSLSGGVILAPDNDAAGIKWRNSLTSALKRYIPIFSLPPVSNVPGADIGDLASNPDEVYKLLEQKVESWEL